MKAEIEKLKAKSLKQCETKGHLMGKWTEYGWRHFCVCTKCGYQLEISGIPTNNSINVSGRALKKECRR